MAMSKLHLSWLVCALVCLKVAAKVNNTEQLSGSSSKANSKTASTCDLPKSLTDQSKDSTFQPLPKTTMSSVVTDMVWVGKDDQHIFATTLWDETVPPKLYRSDDGGNEWTDITGTLKASVQGNPNIAIVATLANSADARHLLFMNATDHIWVTHDFGNTVKAIAVPWAAETAVVRQHPENSDWLLALVQRDPRCDDSTAPRPCVHDLLLTKEAFSEKPWTNLTKESHGKIAGFVDFDWAIRLCEKGCPRDEQGKEIKVPSDSILASIFSHPGDLDLAWDPDVFLVRSDDSFRSWRQLFACADQFEIVGRAIYMAMSNLCPTDGAGNKRQPSTHLPNGVALYTSIDAGNTFSQACIPEPIQQEGYELLYTHDHEGAMAIIDYVGKGTLAASVYTAGPHHNVFTKSLGFVKQGTLSGSDFVRVEGVPGLFIANQWRRSDCWDCEDLRLTNPNNIVVTRITFSNGAAWGYIPAPKTFNDPKCDTCAGKSPCFLHLNGISNWVVDDTGMATTNTLPSIYSNKDAPGLLMATGNVAPKGRGLDMNTGLCTWMSNDGGASWKDVFVGAYIYEYADWGGVVVVAKHTHSGFATEVKFSIDYGNCWATVPLQYAMSVQNIRIEPDGQRPTVIVHGKACIKDRDDVGLDVKCSVAADSADQIFKEGLLYTFDITQLMNSTLKNCNREKDYEKWEVVLDDKHVCLLGQIRHFWRRSPISTCLNGADWVRPDSETTACECSVEHDVECEYGFKPKSGGECELLPPSAHVPCCPAMASGKYVVSSKGTRLVPGTKCSNPDKVIPDTDGMGKVTNKKEHKHIEVPGGPHCAAGSSHSSGGGGVSALTGFLIFLLVAGTLAGTVAAWWHFLASDNAKAAIREALAPVGALFGSMYGWIVDKFSGSRYSRAPQAADELGYFQPLGDSHLEPPNRERGNFTL